MITDLSHLTGDEITRRLASASDIPLDGPYPEGLLKPNLRTAAVLIPLAWVDNAWQLVLIRRAEHSEDMHSGQVAFPGGGSHPTDPDPQTTALREAYEEIGLMPTDVQIVGKLNSFVTISSYIVTPIVGIIPWPYEFTLASDEVSRVFTIPLEWLADNDNFEVRQREFPFPYPPISVIYYKTYDGEVLWGASARFTVGLIDILKEKPARE